jgi:acyl carrier protein
MVMCDIIRVKVVIFVVVMENIRQREESKTFRLDGIDSIAIVESVARVENIVKG